MADTSENIDLVTFLKAAGESFTDAQKSLIPETDFSVNMMLNNAELELKVAVSSNPAGKMSIRTISSDDISRGDIDPGLVSTIKINFVSSITELPSRPVQRGTTTGTTGTATGTAGTTAARTVIPNVVGRDLDEAAAILKSNGWQFEPHAAGADEIAASGSDTRGLVLRQEPAAGQPGDKASTVVQIWVNLGSVPVKEIDGIGDKMGDNLSRLGITSLGELSLANVRDIAANLKMSESRAQSFVDMATLMSRLAVLGFRDEVVELLVKGANIRSMSQLQSADPEELFRVCQESVESGKVRVPRGFTFTVDDVRSWIKAAGGR